MSITKPTPGSAQRVTGHLKRVQRREGAVWYVKTRVPGRTPEQTTHRLAPAHLAGGKPPTGSLTRRQAQDALADLLAAERRRVGEGAYDHQPDGATFADAAAGFLRHVELVKGREFSTVKDYRLSIDRYLVPRWGDRPVRSITPADVAKLRDECMAQGLAPRTVVRHLTVAHGIFKHAVREHGLTRNPASAELVDRPTVRYSGEFETFDADELAALVRAAADEQDGALFLTAAMTGLRQRAAGAALARYRLRRAARPRPPRVVAGGEGREVAEVRQGAQRAARRRARRAAGWPEPSRALHRRRRPRVLHGRRRAPRCVGAAPSL
jgi:hypothetical protein